MNLEKLAEFRAAIKEGDVVQVEFEKGIFFRKKAIETGKVTEIGNNGVEIDINYTVPVRGGINIGMRYISYADLLDYRKVEEPKKQ